MSARKDGVMGMALRQWVGAAVLLVGVMVSARSEAACTSPNGRVGSIKYDAGQDRFEYCNGNDVWASLGSGSTTSGAITASGAAVEFTAIPPGVRRVTVMLSGVSTNGTSTMGVQLGDSGGYETTGYLAAAGIFTNSNTTRYITSTALFPLSHAIVASNTYNHTYIFTHAGGNTWFVTGTGYSAGHALMTMSSGYKTLSDSLDRIRLTTEGGVNTFDAGTISVAYE